MLARAVYFRRDGSIYTLFSVARMPSYLIKWAPVWKEAAPDAKDRTPSVMQWKPEVNQEIHDKACTGMRVARHGQICVNTSDGFAIILDADSLKPALKPKKLSNMPITSSGFFQEELLVSASADYCYNLIPLSSFSAVGAIRNLVIQIAVLLLILLFAVDYFYDDHSLLSFGKQDL
jgi:hypothetical protein